MADPTYGCASPQPSTSRQQLLSEYEENSSDEENEDNPADYSSGDEESSYAHPEEESDGSEEDMEQTPRHNTTRQPRRGASNTRLQETMKWTNGQAFTPTVHHFDVTHSGISDNVTIADDSPYLDYFNMFFDHSLMDTIVTETNNYFVFSGGYTDTSPASRTLRWTDSTIPEMYTFLGLSILMSIVRLHSIHEYWSTTTLVPTPIFGKYMSRDRFLLLMKYLHFTNNRNENKEDRVRKIRKIYEGLRKKFKQVFHPFQRLVIDESLVLFKGRLAFKQYIPSKRHRFGIKLFVLCDCETGMILDFIIYTGKTTEIPRNDPLGVSGAVVKALMQPYLGKGHTLYCDNWYSSPRLCKYLTANNTNYVGTVRTTRKDMPKLCKGLKRSEINLQKCDDILSVQWRDKREVNFLSTIHTGEMQDSGKRDYRTGDRIMKPDVVLDYTQHMRTVDKSDMQIGNIECLRKSTKWYKKLFFHFVDIAILNAYNLYLVKTGKRVPLKVFCSGLVHQILERYGTPTSGLRGRALSRPNLPDRLGGRDYIARHYLMPIPPPENQEGETRKKRKRAQRQCTVCAHSETRDRVRQLVTTMCKECQLPMCMLCFQIYHVQTRY